MSAQFDIATGDEGFGFTLMPEPRPPLPKPLISTELGAVMALFTDDLQVQALRRQTVQVPSPIEPVAQVRENIDKVLEGTFATFGAKPLTPDLVPVAKMVVFVRSASNTRVVGHSGSRAAQLAAVLVNLVAEAHPELLTTKAAWETHDGARTGLMNFFVGKKLHPDVELLTPAAAVLLAKGLTQDTLRHLVSNVEMDGDSVAGAWACRLPVVGAPHADVLDAMLTRRAYERLLEEASKSMTGDDARAECAQEILGRLAEGVALAREGIAKERIVAGKHGREKELVELVGSIDAGAGFNAFAGNLVSHLIRGRLSRSFIQALPGLGRTIGLDSKGGARRFGTALIRAVGLSMEIDPLKHRDLIDRFADARRCPAGPNAEDDFMNVVTDFMRANGELSPDFVTSLRAALLDRKTRLPAALDSRFAHALMQAQLDAKAAAQQERRAGESDEAGAKPRRRKSPRV